MKNNVCKLKTYKKDFNYSYVTGAYPTIEMLKCCPGAAKVVYIHSKYTGCSLIEEIIQNRIPVIRDDKIFKRMGAAGNSYVLGVFHKYNKPLNAKKPHIVLVHPGDMGNLGTIIRTVAGLGYKDLAIVKPAADIFDPKTVRSSMGALFKINFEYFESFEEYMIVFPEHELFVFMSDAENVLGSDICPDTTLFSLIFGNEANGLDDCFKVYGTAVRIRQTPDVDSFNLASASAIGAYVFAHNSGMQGNM